jgi:predicted esterase
MAMTWRNFRATRNAGFGLFLILAFGGVMLWANSRDRYQRIWLKLKPPGGEKTEAVIVLPKLKPPFPVAIFAYGSGESVLQSGNVLRQFAELGFAAVTFEYDKKNQTNYNAQFQALQEYLGRQSWAKTNQIAWIGFSLGAQRMLSLALTQPALQPAILARLGGGSVPALQPFLENTNSTAKVPLHSAVILAHGEADNIFSVEDARRLADLCRQQGVPVQLHVFPGRGHGLDSDLKVFYRVLAEYCRSESNSGQSLEILPEGPKGALPFLLCIVPSLLWAGYWFRLRSRLRCRNQTEPQAPPRWERSLRYSAVLLATVALGQAAWHLIPPRLAVSDKTLAVARKSLIPPKWLTDFEELASKPYWRGQKLKTLLTHVELSNYCVYELINWKMDTNIYKEFVLSPIIDSEADLELNWRRPLWEFYYPRIRKENDTQSAAEIVVRTLRERVTIDPKHEWPIGIESIWRNQITTPEGFERIYVAALRSTGVPARLDQQKRAEFWTDSGWKPAPRPLVETWL